MELAVIYYYLSVIIVLLQYICFVITRLNKNIKKIARGSEKFEKLMDEDWT